MKPLILLAVLLLLAPLVRAQTEDQIKAAAAYPLNVELLDSLDAFVKNITADPAAGEELAAMFADSSITPESVDATVASKYPKLAAAFKSAGLTPGTFVRGWTALGLCAMQSENSAPIEDKAVQANIDFFKSNQERISKTMNTIEALGQGADS